MKSIFILLLAACFYSTVCAQNFPGTCYSNLKEFKIINPKYKSFVLISQEYESLLGVVDTGNHLKFIQASLDGFLNKYHLSFSPDYQYILIESVGEGHPYITIYKTDELAASGVNDTVTTVAILDPYPFWINDLKWLGNSIVWFSSPVDFSKFDKDLHRGYSDLSKANEQERTWKWDFIKGIFTEIKN